MPGDVAAIEHTINKQGLPSPFRIRGNPILMIPCIALRIGSIMVTDKPRRSCIRDGWAVTGCQQIIRAQKDCVCHDFYYIPSRTRESEMWQRNLGTLQDQQIESLWKREVHRRDFTSLCSFEDVLVVDDRTAEDVTASESENVQDV